MPPPFSCPCSLVRAPYSLQIRQPGQKPFDAGLANEHHGHFFVAPSSLAADHGPVTKLRMAYPVPWPKSPCG